MKSQSLHGLAVDGPAQSLELIRDALGRRKTENGQKAAEMIVLNAGAALYAADHASSLKQGVELAHDALHTGLARKTRRVGHLPPYSKWRTKDERANGSGKHSGSQG